MEGDTYTSSQATIWRWRDAFQNDFAARMQWALPGNVSRANHHPLVSINGSSEIAPLNLTVTPGTTVTLDAMDTVDPDGLDIRTSLEGQVAQVAIPAEEESCNGKGYNPSGCWLLHLTLEVTDNGYHPLTSHRRVLLQTSNSIAVAI